MQVNSVMDLAAAIEHTRVKGTDDIKDVKQICAEALTHNFAAICVNPFFVPEARRLLGNCHTELCTGIGFPLGASLLEVKVEEIRQVISWGADAVDFVINIGALKSGMFDVLVEEMDTLVKESKRAVSKLIIETCYLTNDEIFKVSQKAADAGIDYVKTSTGMGTRGASLEDVKIIKNAVGDKCKIKAAGGIQTLDQALALIEAGASRLGTSRGVELIEAFKQRV